MTQTTRQGEISFNMLVAAPAGLVMQHVTLTNLFLGDHALVQSSRSYPWPANCLISQQNHRSESSYHRTPSHQFTNNSVLFWQMLYCTARSKNTAKHCPCNLKSRHDSNFKREELDPPTARPARTYEYNYFSKRETVHKVVVLHNYKSGDQPLHKQRVWQADGTATDDRRTTVSPCTDVRALAGFVCRGLWPQTRCWHT